MVETFSMDYGSEPNLILIDNFLFFWKANKDMFLLLKDRAKNFFNLNKNK